MSTSPVLYALRCVRDDEIKTCPVWDELFQAEKFEAVQKNNVLDDIIEALKGIEEYKPFISWAIIKELEMFYNARKDKTTIYTPQN